MAACKYDIQTSLPVKRVIVGLLIGWLSMILTACDPSHDQLYPSTTAKVTGKFNKVSGAINLGDTLSFYVEIPDTLLANPGGVVVNNLQKAEIYIDICAIDTVGKRVELLAPPLFWTGSGQISTVNSTAFQFRSATKPYRLIVHFRPTVKGLYFFGMSSQLGDIRANNGFAARLLVDFDLANRYTELAAPFLGSNWANDVRFREPGGYVFRVN